LKDKFLEILGTISTVLAITGVVLNNYLDSRCFYVWLVSNTISAWIHIEAGIWSLAARDVIFIGLAFHGLRKWKTKQ
jgi:nicotinamide riboside transporter PnuC